jgi:hypothetical protein
VVKARLGVESLEDILAPANLTWANLTGDGNGMDFQDYYVTNTTTVATAPLAQGDNLTFDGAVSNASATGLEGFGNAIAPGGTPPDELSDYADFDSIILTNSYSGTVSLAPSFNEESGAQVNQVSVMTLEVQSGTIAQQAVTIGNQSQIKSQAVSPPPPSITSTDLTVYDTIDWTGGTIGNAAPGSTTAANLWLEGGGTIEPANAGTVTLGSSLEVDALYGATTLTEGPGTLQMVNANAGGQEVKAGAAAVADVSRSTTATYTINGQQNSGQNVTIDAGGTFTMKGAGNNAVNNWVKSTVPVINNGGTVALSGNATAKPVVYDYQQSGNATLQIESGSPLSAVAGGVDIKNGTVLLKTNANLPALQQIAQIDGNLTFEGGTIKFDPPILIGTALAYGSFGVSGNVTWSGGTYMPGVDFTGFGIAANRWTILGTLTIPAMNTASIQDVPQHVPPVNGNPPPAGKNWLILAAGRYANNNGVPTVNKDNLGNQFKLDTTQAAGWELDT